MKALILAAGLGARLGSITDNKPKALVEVNGIPLIEIVIKRLIDSGFNSLIVNVHHYAEQIMNYLNMKKNFGIEIKISDESNQLLDTGGGLKKAAWFFNNGKPFLVHNVDILTDLDLYKLYNFQLSNGCIATLAVQQRKSSRYFLFDEQKKLCGWQNEKINEIKMARKPEGNLSKLAFSGIHAADPIIFNFMPKDKIFSLVDLFLQVASLHQITYFEHTNSLFMDLGKKENLVKAEQLLKEKILYEPK